MRVGIVGSRQTYDLTLAQMEKYIPKECSCIVSGGAQGVDTFARQLAIRRGIPIEEIRPNYPLFGKVAPLVRNTEIVKKAEKVFAFWDYRSRGTAHAIKECIRLEVPVQVISIKRKG